MERNVNCWSVLGEELKWLVRCASCTAAKKKNKNKSFIYIYKMLRCYFCNLQIVNFFALNVIVLLALLCVRCWNSCNQNQILNQEKMKLYKLPLAMLSTCSVWMPDRHFAKTDKVMVTQSLDNSHLNQINPNYTSDVKKFFQ